MEREVLYEVRGPKTLKEMTCAELKKAQETADIVVMSFAAVENHAAHLPLGADIFQGEELIKRVAMLLTERGLPAVPGYCLPFGCQTNQYERSDSFGNICLSQKTFIDMVEEISLSLVANGFKRLVFCINHMENNAALHVAAKDLGDIHGIPVIVANWVPPTWDELPKFLKNTSLQGHAGEDETASVMYVVPNLVDLSNAGEYHSPEDTRPSVPFDDLIYFGGAVGIYTPTGHNNTPGFEGNPADATIETGDICHDHNAKWTADVVCKYWGDTAK